MSSRVTLQSYSAWPMSVDLDMFRAYVRGLSVDETLDYLLNITPDRHRDDERQVGTTTSPTLGTLGGQPSSVHTLSNEEHSVECHVGATSFEGDNDLGSDVGEKMRGPVVCADCDASTTARGTFCDNLQRMLALTAVKKPMYLRQEIEGQFNMFDMLRDNYLVMPYAFLSSYAIPITLRDRRILVEEYYSVNEEVLKFFFGDRLHNMELDGEPEGRFFWHWYSGPKYNLQGLRDTGISNSSLKRQWENLKRVCMFLHSAYRGKGGQVIPRTTPLLVALQQCFAFRGVLGENYATFAFGFEHCLKCRFFERLSYAECVNLYNILATMWCDDSNLMLRQSFCTLCTRIARFLDDNRVVAEIHNMAFGETMRPRWQQQLDGMQRAISTNTGVGNASSTQGKSDVNNLGNMEQPTVSNVSFDLLPRDCSHQRQESNSFKDLQPTETQTRKERLPCNAGSSTNVLQAGQEATNNIVFSNTCGMSSAVGGANYSNLSANRAFSRRFLSEFSNIIKNLVRVAAVIGNTGGLREALDAFYTRVYLPLENMGTRSACVHPTDCGVLRPGAFTSPTAPQPVACAAGTGPATNLAGSTGRHLPSPSSDTNNGNGASGWEEPHNDEKVSLLSGTGPNTFCGTNCGGTAGARLAKGHPYPMLRSSLSFGSSSGNIAGMVDKGLYLRELCLLLNSLPNFFARLTQISEEDHTECGGEFRNLVLALRMLVQILTAAGDR
uniref:Uncharacterized protein n=1 Tax=Trypanosoma congolense (strain IL3000) TaxID=1068625 RepID=G0UXT3_TRYCI|nr:conserved hypothetical protein [Trypanosoma congolense IL3000]